MMWNNFMISNKNSSYVFIEGSEYRFGKKSAGLHWIEEKFDENFKQVISNFLKEKLPRIYELLDKYKDKIDINILKSRDEADNYIKKMNKNIR